MTMENTAEYSAYEDDRAVYVERVEMKDIGLDTLDTWDLTQSGSDQTHLNFNINWRHTQLPPEIKQGMLQGIQANLNAFKVYCEQ
jgi:hypothetical protein